MSLSSLHQFFDLLEKSSSILITTKHYANTDGIASALVMARICRALGKQADIVTYANIELYQFLPDISTITRSFTGARQCLITVHLAQQGIAEVEQHREGDSVTFSVLPITGSIDEKNISIAQGKFLYDAIISIDAPDLDSLGLIYQQHPQFFFSTPIINIDHTVANEQFGQINIIELTATSTCEILTSIIEDHYKDILDADTATLLLSGVIEETDSFKRAIVTPKSLTIANKLIAAGARREDIVAGLFQNKSLSVLKLWGRALARIKCDEQTNMYWSLLAKNDFEKTESSEHDIDGVMKEFISHTPRAGLIVLLYEKGVKEIGVRCRANTSINLLDALGPIQPNGSHEHITAVIKGEDILTAERIVLENLNLALAKA